MFVLSAEKNKLTVRKREPVTSGSVNVYKARFEFSDDWEGLTRKAVFIGSGVQVPVLLDESSECEIPWEVLTKHGGRLMAGVFGTTDDSALPTIRADLGVILEGVTADGELSKPPTPDIWQQELDTKGDALTYDGLNLTLMSGKKALSTVRITGGGTSDLPTIKDAFIDNISYFEGFRLPCCIHCVNAILGYTFNDDILYVSRSGDMLIVVTMDNATVVMSISPETGELDLVKAQRLETRLELIEDDIKQLQQTGGGTSYQFGHGLKVTGNTVSVDAVSDFTGDNTLPMTAAGVQTTVGNIEALLGTI